MKKLQTLSMAMFVTKNELYQAKINQFKKAFAEVSEQYPDNAELKAFIEKVNSKTLSKFLSVNDMNIEKSKLYEDFVKSSPLFTYA